MYGVPHLYMLHDSFIYVAGRIHQWDIPHLYVIHMRVRHVHTCNMPHVRLTAHLMRAL